MKYSVIIPIYNKAKTISAAIESVIKQTSEDYEIIVVNDGSTDNFQEVIRQFTNIKVINQNNQGVSVARNNGIKNAIGEFICFLDADDIWLPNHLEELDRLINLYPQNSFFCTSYEIHQPNGKVIKSSDYLKEIQNKEEFIIDNLFYFLNKYSDVIIHTNSICIRKSLFINENCFFEPGIKIGEDTDLWYRIALKNSLVITKKITTLYRREYSDATKYTSNVNNWIFSMRLKNILNDSNISSDVKNECIKLIDRYFLNCSRCLAIENKKKEAKNIFKKVTMKKGKTYYLTFIFICMPSFICRIISNRIMNK